MKFYFIENRMIVKKRLCDEFYRMETKTEYWFVYNDGVYSGHFKTLKEAKESK